MINFANPEYLFGLLLVPVIILGYALLRFFRTRKIAKIGDENLVRQLMPSYSRTKGWVKVVLFSIGLLFFFLGAARPQIGAKLSKHEAKGAEIIIALDVSNSMLAQDYSPTRLERAKLAISRLVDNLREDRIGLIVFAGTSFVQLPITTDYVSAKMFLNTISTTSVPIQGTAIGEAISTALKAFSSQSSKSRAIIIITDGENHEDDAVKVAKEAADMGIRVFTIGVGTPKGSLIQLADGGFIKDEDDNPVVTKLDEKLVLDIAATGNGAYIHATNTEVGLGPIVDEIAKMDAEEFSSVVFEEYDEQYMYFLAVSLVFFVTAFLIGSRRNKKKLF